MSLRAARVALAAVVVLLAAATPAPAHFGAAGAAASSPLPGVPAFSAGLLGPSSAPIRALRDGGRAGARAIDGRDGSTFEGGPCTGAAAAGFPEGPGHDHADITQHRFACGMQQIAFLPLVEELRARPDVILGEMDVKAGIAAVGVTYPEGGVLLFDVKDARDPRFLSWYRAGACEALVLDINCGAFVDLSADGRTVYLSTQNTSVLPVEVPAGVAPTNIPGVYAIDISDPRAPRLTDVFPTLNLGGVHTARSHVIPGKGEFVFTNTLSAQGLTPSRVDILRAARDAQGRPTLRRVNSIEVDEIHDTFIQNDALDGRTYLYIASGFASGFLVYDVTDPADPVLKAEWDLTPQCEGDWYSHTIDVAVRGGRRYVTMPTESIADFGEQSAEDQAEGCGRLFGNGDVPGVLWIVDATDFTKLGPAEPLGADDEPALAAASRAALVATWSNAADRAGGNILFSAHNQQIVGDLIYLSHYHGGVQVLDASRAFRGEKVRPKEVGFIVPHGETTRPIYRAPVTPVSPFFSNFEGARSSLWDAYVYEGVVFAADEYGGFYALERAPTERDPAATTPAAQRPKVAFRITRSATRRRASCRDARLLARVSGSGTRAARRVTFLAGKRTLAVDRSRPFQIGTTRRRIGKGRAVTARIVFADGRVQRVTRRVRACG